MKMIILLSLVAASLASEAVFSEFTTANNKFSATVYKEIVQSETGNFLVSPFSAEIVLAFTHSGAKGPTAQELRNVLHLPENHAQIEREVKTLLPSMKGSSDYILHIANKLYVKHDFELKEDFKKAATEVYSADVEKVDFLKKEETADAINNWVEKQTENKIQNLLNPDLLTNKTRLILINALYFSANWSQPFRFFNTYNMTFHKTASEVVKVETMRSMDGDHFLYFECHHLNVKFLELPFEGEDASMTFILPNDQQGLAALEAQIERAVLPHNLTRERVDVSLPRFKIQSKIDLKKILKELGVNLLFKNFKSDLSGIAGKKGELVVSEVIQKTFIDVNEEGVEAAAATLSMVATPDADYLGKPFEFIADHPFLFYVKVKGNIVFIGRVCDPIS